LSAGLWCAACTLTLLQHALPRLTQRAAIYFSWIFMQRAFVLACLVLSGLPSLLEMLWTLLSKPSLSVDVLMNLAALLLLAVGHLLEGTLLFVLFSVSRAAEGAIRARARRDLDALRDSVPEYAWRLRRASDTDTPLELVAENGTLNTVDAHQVPVTELTPGDLILVKAGEVVPCDCQIARGDAYVSLEPITGESVPRRVRDGELIAAGARTVDGSLYLRVQRPVHESAVARIARLVTNAQQNKPTLERWIDRFGQLYSRFVVTGALLVFIVAGLTPVRTPKHSGHGVRAVAPQEQPVRWRAQRQAFERALGFMVVASPCALIIGAPVAYTSALGVLARRGVLVKGGARTLEASARCDKVAFDKTGTLTKGEPELHQIQVFRVPRQSAVTVASMAATGDAATDTSTASEDLPYRWDLRAEHPPAEHASAIARVLALAAGLEAHVVHPLGRAVAASVAELGIEPLLVHDVKVCAGAGLEGRIFQAPHSESEVTSNGGGSDQHLDAASADALSHRVRLGRLDFAATLLEHENAPQSPTPTTRELDQKLEAYQREQAALGRSTALLCCEDGTVAMLVFWDQMREEAPACIAQLRTQGYSVQLLTGDSKETALAIAEAVGVPADCVRYALRPEDKMLFVKQQPDRLVMVGDGMNDAPALALATTGISIGFHSATAVSAADVVLVDGYPEGIRRIAWYLQKSRQTQRVMTQNVAIALILIVSTAIGAVSGGLPLWAAVLLHEGGTLLVGLSGLRLLMD
jgi:Cd2+/Zn2+-exporting ATPase